MNKRKSRESEDVAGGLTNRKRFFSGLDFTYSITFPLGIHSVIMRKQCGSVETETPNKGKMFGWDKYFQPTISRHNRWVRVDVERWECTGLIQGTLKILSESPSFTLRHLRATRNFEYCPSFTSASPPR